MAAELLRKGAKSTAALPPALPRVSQMSQACCGQGCVVTCTAGPCASGWHQEFQTGQELCTKSGWHFCTGSTEQCHKIYSQLYVDIWAFQHLSNELSPAKSQSHSSTESTVTPLKRSVLRRLPNSLLTIQPAKTKLHILLLSSMSH